MLGLAASGSLGAASLVSLFLRNLFADCFAAARADAATEEAAPRFPLPPIETHTQLWCVVRLRRRGATETS